MSEAEGSGQDVWVWKWILNVEVFLDRNGCGVFVVNRGKCWVIGDELGVGFGRWLLSEWRGEFWRDFAGCVGGGKLWKQVCYWGRKLWFFWFCLVLSQAHEIGWWRKEKMLGFVLHWALNCRCRRHGFGLANGRGWQ